MADVRGVFIALTWALGVIGVALSVATPQPARGEIAGRYVFEGDDGICLDYPQHDCACAHRILPFGTLIRIRRIGRTIVCRVVAAGSNMPGGLDFGLNASAARQLGLVDAPAHVRIERLGRLE